MLRELGHSAMARAQYRVGLLTEGMRLRREARHVEVAVRDRSQEFPDEFRQNLPSVAIVGAASDWNLGWNSFQYRLMHQSADSSRKVAVYDPRFLDEDGKVDEARVKALGEDPTQVNVLTSLDALPRQCTVFLLSPNRFHVEQLQRFLADPSVAGVYVEKPMGISPKELATLDALVRGSTKPIFFGDHYVYQAAPLLALMGKPLPGEGCVRVTYDPMGHLSRVLGRHASRLPFGPQRLLGRIARVEAKTAYPASDNLVQNRSWLQKESTGGGVLLDLGVHQLNVLEHLGLGLGELAQAVRQEHRAGADAGEFEPLVPGQDRAEDYARIEGVTRHGNARVSLELEQFAERPQNYIRLTDKRGRQLHFDYETKTVEYRNNRGVLLGKAELDVDAVVLMQHHALAHVERGKPRAVFYTQQRHALTTLFQAKEVSASSTGQRRSVR
jgi:predicted dehydrogenase